MTARRLTTLALCLVAALGGAERALAAQCGLPDTTPLWVDFSDGSVSFRDAIFGRPGVIAATTGVAVSASLRERGAYTIAWDMHLERRVGTPTAPADPTGIAAAADSLFDFAAASSACSRPLIALNELLGQALAPPWTPENALYRANVLSFIDRMAVRGARPFLLLPNSNPQLGGEALLWWQRVAEQADLVRQVYFNATTVSALGPLLGSRRLRTRMRDAARALITAGFPASRIGLMLGFHSGSASSGRAGLQSREAWFEYVKLNALAARQVAGELGLATMWSWGWGTFNDVGNDPDKPTAACVYLWTRDPTLCDGPAMAGPFNASRTEGQIALPPGVQCTFAAGQIRRAAVDEAAAATRDLQAAFTALFARVVQRARVVVKPTEITRAEATIVERRFSRRRSAYLRELRRRKVTLAFARAVIADELRRQRLAAAVDPDVEGWTVAAQTKALDTATCLADELPAIGDIRLASKLPFLRLSSV